ncbi:MAG TPA: crotonase/enoyl-CoA hydratase family protein [Nitrospira sp.]|nr:crotonase/enoyl-CoA hydratase family protein [Nitrospira sp.]
MKAAMELGASPHSVATQPDSEARSLGVDAVEEGHASAAARLLLLDQLEVTWEEATDTLWTFMRPHGRPCYNLKLLDDFHAWQRDIVPAFGPSLRYLVLGSRTTGAFNLGGDLNYFLSCIEEKDRAALLAYGVSCIQILYRNIERLGLPIVTIGIAQGDALGGGLESLLSFNVIIAERQARFGFPESHFGLFPGMGAYNLVSRRVGSVIAEQMILSGRIYTAEEMKEIGLVHILAEPGQGVVAARDYIRDHSRRHAGLQGFFQAMREVDGVTFEELERVVEIWADTCLKLGQRELRIMQRLVSAQDRLYCAPDA